MSTDRARPRHRRKYQRGPHIYPRRLKTGIVYYAYLPSRPEGVSLRTRDPREAEHRLAAILAGALDTADVGADPSERAVREVVARFLAAPHGYTTRSLRSASNRLTAFGTWCEEHGAIFPSEITTGKLDDWINERMNKVSRCTINRDLHAVRKCFRWAAESKLCAVNDAIAARDDLREPKREKRHIVPDPAEMRKILAAAEELHAGAHKALVVLYATGRRIEELRRLTPFDVRDGVLYVRPEPGPAATAEPGKQYDTLTIPIAKEVEQALRAFFKWRTGPRTACSEGWLLGKLHDACTRAKVDPCGLHDLRRGFATEAHNAGIEIRVISRWLGHKDVRTTERYIAAYRSDLKVQAPIPGGLLPAELVQNQGVKSGRSESHVQGERPKPRSRK